VKWHLSTDGGINFSDIVPAVTSTSFTFTATASMNGYEARAVFTNAVGQAFSNPATLTVTQAPAITSAKSATFIVGQQGSFTVTTQGLPAPILSATGLPSGLNFVDNGNGTARLVGTPFPNTGGVSSITITAHNSSGPDAVQILQLIVDQPPAIAGPVSTNFNVNQNNTFTILTTGFPKVSATAVGVGLPATIKIAIDPSTGKITLSGKPAVTGTYKILITAGNGIGLNAMEEFTLTVI
jgi:hypothetical protein